MHIINYLRLTSCITRCICLQVLCFPEDVIGLWSKLVEASKVSIVHKVPNKFVCTALFFYTVDGERRSLLTRRHFSDNGMLICVIYSRTEHDVSKKWTCFFNTVSDAITCYLPVIPSSYSKYRYKNTVSAEKKLARQSTLYFNTDRWNSGRVNTRGQKCALYSVQLFINLVTTNLL